MAFEPTLFSIGLLFTGKHGMLSVVSKLGLPILGHIKLIKTLGKCGIIIIFIKLNILKTLQRKCIHLSQEALSVEKLIELTKYETKKH